MPGKGLFRAKKGVFEGIELEEKCFLWYIIKIYVPDNP